MSRPILPKALVDLINEFGNLPGVGARTAERYAYFLVKDQTNQAKRLASSLDDLQAGVKFCPVTFALIDSDEEVSSLYTDEDRDKTVVAVVEEPLDIVALETTGKFYGTYHVLGGVLSPIDGVTPDDLTIEPLLKRLVDDQVKELIIATNASVEGESTALYIKKLLAEREIEVELTRLAQGLPIGTDLEYADQITIGRALEGRRHYG